MKTAAVIVSGAPAGDNLREVEIPTGTSAGDVLRALNLNGYLLSREGSAQAFAAEEDLYSAINNGDKLRATPVAEVGGVVESILELFGAAPVLVRNRTVAQVRILPDARLPSARHLRVERDQRPLWEVRGWRQTGRRLTGAYRTPRGSCAGEIILHRGTAPEFYIVNPPQTLLRGPHGACFRSRGSRKYFVHFGHSSPEVDAGIVGIEKLIARALEKRSA